MKLGRLGFAALAIAAMLALVMAGCGNPSDGTVWHPPGEQQPPPPPPPILPPTVCDCCGADCECEEPGDCGEPDCECGEADTGAAAIWELSADTDIDGALGDSDWLTGSGSPTIVFGANNSFTVSGRSADWHTFDILIADNAASLPAGSYTLTITGTTVAGTAVRVSPRASGSDDSAPWGPSVDAAADGSFTIVQNFTSTGTAFTTNSWDNPSVPLFSFRVLGGSTVDYTITNIVIAAAD